MSDSEVSDPMANGSERPPKAYVVTVEIPWELMSDVQKAQVRYGGPLDQVDEKTVRRLLLDALCRELNTLGYYGSGATMWYGSPMHRTGS